MTTDRDAQLTVLERMVADHRAADSTEATHRDRVLGAIKAHSLAIVERTCRPGHLTGSAMVVDPSRRQLVVLHHAKLDIWVQPGGHADGDVDLGAVALREASEETGIADLRLVRTLLDIDVHEVRPRDDDPHDHLDLRFLVLAPEQAQLDHNDESTAARWVSPDEARALNGEAGLARLVAKATEAGYL